jgi:hypothetical protein
MRVGDVVRDELNDDSDLLVVALTSAIASEYSASDGETVADCNPNYPADDAVVEVVYLSDQLRDVADAKRYGFPISRLSEEDDE